MKIISTRKAIFALLCLATVIQAFADGSFSENGFNYTIMKKDSSTTGETETCRPSPTARSELAEAQPTANRHRETQRRCLDV